MTPAEQDIIRQQEKLKETQEETYWTDDYWEIEEPQPDPANPSAPSTAASIALWGYREEVVEAASEAIVRCAHLSTVFFDVLLDELVVGLMKDEFVYLGETPGRGGYPPPSKLDEIPDEPDKLEQEDKVLRRLETETVSRVNVAFVVFSYKHDLSPCDYSLFVSTEKIP